MKEASLDTLLRELVSKEGSDLHLKVGEPPSYRIHGKLMRSKLDPLTDKVIERLIFGIMNEDRKQIFLQRLELDMSYSISGLSRFRVNVFKQKGHIGAVMRVIPFDIKNIDDLQLPEILKKIVMYPRGLVLVTGPTGSGKSTTLAAMIEHINHNKRCHIITIEDPIEFLHKDRVSTIEQREIGLDTHSFADALRHVMRQSPDIIMVGEMRDLETMALTVTAAETGHLVFATLHTTDAPQTVDRIIDVFPPEKQQQVRLQLSTVLAAVLSQTLLPRAAGDGRIAAFETMICIPAVRSIIREGKAHQLYSILQTGQKYGMVQLDQHLKELYQKRIVKFEDALAKSNNPEEFQKSVDR